MYQYWFLLRVFKGTLIPLTVSAKAFAGYHFLGCDAVWFSRRVATYCE
jgi:hypothetical protein